MSAILPPGSAAFGITDLPSGLSFLARLPTANPPVALDELQRFLDSLLLAEIDGDVLLTLLEQARVSLGFVGDELSLQFVNQPLPLAEGEENTFRRLSDLWLKTARAYARCPQLAGDDDASASEQRERLALILHRCLYYTGLSLFEHQRARREPPAGLWLDIHGYFASAEEWGVATLAVPDTLDPFGRSSHCTAAYVTLLLPELASPYSLPVTDQELVRRLGISWAPLVGVHAVRGNEGLPQFVVDLMYDGGLRPSHEYEHGGQLRRLDTGRLSLQMNHARAQLKQKIPPTQLGFGSDCSTTQCMRLLELLARPWAQARAPRKFRRHASAGLARVCTGFEGIHYVLSGRVFSQPENVSTYSRKEFDALFAFRHMVDPTQQLQIQQEQLGIGADTWEVVNQSANGFRLTRSIAGRRMAHAQLIAVSPPDGDRFLLAQSNWLMQERDGGLLAGVAVLPGIPVALAARPLPEAGRREPYTRAFLLGAVPAIGAEASLVLPAGWFHYGRIIEVFNEGVWRVRLSGLLQEGSDFARVSFATAG
ncbi:hypothetical protein [Rhodocyclus tenuis]|uniref:hypothetical protein n=1 Tax=Rhodocyclus tenuis TaxID=1066 RepID=UPI001906E359|nr:hypothetical protein [Rhodocyclus tenuis]MBK1681482.1 hypothetical protein [Rhodocyclus tenuis]